MSLSTFIAHRLRRTADRIDHPGAPKGIGWSFTLEPGLGIRFNEAGRGCRLWYLNDADYDRAHNEAITADGLFESLVKFCPHCGVPVNNQWIDVTVFSTPIHDRPRLAPGRWWCSTDGCVYNPRLYGGGQ